MSEFTKTVIVDLYHDEDPGHYRQTIKAAVVDLGSSGGVVIVEAGTYDIDGNGNNTTVDIPDDVTIIGKGAVILNVTAGIPVFQNYDQTNGNERIVISGFNIVLGLGGSNYPSSPIYMKKIKNCIFENMTIENQSASFNSDRAAIWIEGVTDGDCLGNIVSNCKIYGNTTNGAYRFPWGIYLMGNSKENMLVNNTIDRSKNHGIYLSESSKNVLSGNVITNCMECGIKLDTSDYNSLTDNQISGNSTIGIYLYQSSNCSVQGNVCRVNTLVGTQVEGSSTDGAYYNVISGNVCIGNAGSASTGILLNPYVKYTTVTGNNCSANTQHGIQEVNNANTEKNLFSGNMCNNNGTELVVSSAASIVANNLTD